MTIGKDAVFGARRRAGWHRPSIALLPALVVLGAAVMAVMSGHERPAAIPAARATARGATRPLPAASLSKPAVPTTGAYLGVDAQVGSGDATRQGATSSLDVFRQVESAIDRPIALAAFYMGFDDEPPLSDMEDVVDQGSIPLLSWLCGPSDASIAAGAYDGLIRADAESLRAFAHPVLLRWFWEMNLPNTTGHATCLGDAETAAANYVAAYQRIWTIFQDVGATNVAFVWAPSAAAGAPSASAFYPGGTYVDWVGFDLYDRSGAGPFAGTLSATYPSLVAYGKPIIWSETGAPLDGPGGGSPTQAQWIDEIGSVLPTEFPAVRAVVYVDASDPVGDYILSGSGLTAFAALARSAWFAPTGQPVP